MLRVEESMLGFVRDGFKESSKGSRKYVKSHCRALFGKGPDFSA